jgi:hypothetical protein
MFPELPDARMDTRKPIVHPAQKIPNFQKPEPSQNEFSE